MYQVFSFQSSKGCFNLFPTPHHDRDARLSNSANCGLWSAPPNHFHGKLEGTHWGPHLENICNTFGAHCQRVSHALEHKDINCTSMQHLPCTFYAHLAQLVQLRICADLQYKKSTTQASIFCNALGQSSWLHLRTKRCTVLVLCNTMWLNLFFLEDLCKKQILFCVQWKLVAA